MQLVQLHMAPTWLPHGFYKSILLDPLTPSHLSAHSGGGGESESGTVAYRKPLRATAAWDSLSAN